MEHMWCSTQTSVYYHSVINFLDRMLCCFKNLIMSLLCAAVLKVYCFFLLEKGVKHIMACKWLWWWNHLWMCCCTKFLQCNFFNIHRSITTIVFILDLVYKTGYHFLGIITMTKHLKILYNVLMIYGMCCHIYVSLKFVHVVYELLIFLFMGFKNLCENNQLIYTS